MKRGDALKRAAVALILAAAGVLIAWNLGAFDAPPQPVNDRDVNRPHPGAGPQRF